MEKKYSYPDSFGDMGEYLSETDYDTMDEWPAMPDWYDEAVDRGYEGSYEEFITKQRAKCRLINDKS